MIGMTDLAPVEQIYTNGLPARADDGVIFAFPLSRKRERGVNPQSGEREQKKK